MPKKEEKKAESTGKEVVNWQEELQGYAQKTMKEEKPAAQSIQLKAARFYFNEEELGTEFDAIVVAAATEKCLYTKAYDPDAIDSPDCFAQSLHVESLAPHENVANPQDDKCAGCTMAEFGTARTGKGPACKTYKKLTLLPMDAVEKGIEEADLVTMKVSPTSVKNYSTYANKVAQTGLPPWAVMTRILIKPDPKTQWKVRFKALEPVPEDKLAAVRERIPEAESLLLVPYTYDKETEKEPESSKY